MRSRRNSEVRRTGFPRALEYLKVITWHLGEQASNLHWLHLLYVGKWVDWTRTTQEWKLNKGESHRPIVLVQLVQALILG